MLLQYIIKSDNEDDIMAQARAALDAGITWLEIKAADEVSDDSLASIIEKLRPELAEKNCVLILAGRIDTAKDLKADGVHIYTTDRPVSAARVALEAWPIIGVSVVDKAAAEALRGYDIDYLFLECDKEDEANVVSEIAKYLDEKDIETPLVASGVNSAEDARRLAGCGANAVAADRQIAADASSLKDAIIAMKEVTDKL